MKKIKVKPLFGAHQIYQEIVNFPPKGVEYLGVSGETKKGNYYQNKSWKEKINKIAQFFKIPRMTFVRNGDFDIVHSSRGIIPLTKKPWVIDVEQFTSFMGLHFDIMTKNKFVKRFVEKRLSSKKCKRILCHCEATKKSFLKYLNCSGFEDKLDVLYPSSHIIDFKKEKHKKIRFLAVLSLFEQKGGRYILEAFSRLEKESKNVELWIRGDVSKDLMKRFNSKNVKYMAYSSDIVPRERLIKDIYANCDVFLYSSFCDSFGYSLIDAMVAGLPIIGSNLFAIPELVVDGFNGFVVDIPGYNRGEWIQEHQISKMGTKDEKEFVDGLYKSMKKLAFDKKLRERFSKNSLKRISEGDISIKQRNEKLLKVYGEALK